MISQRYLAVVIAVAAVGLCASCYTYTLYPWFDGDVQVFEERLLGKWGDPENYFEFSRGPEDTYDILDWAGKTLRGRLGKIDGVYYLDVMRKCDAPGECDEAPWLYAVHMLARLEIEEDRLEYTFLDLEKLEKGGMGRLKAIEVGNKTDYENTDGILVVSRTKSLQKFLKKHGRTTDIWVDCSEEEFECSFPRM